MKVEEFEQILGADFYTGVPDSQIKELCNYLMERYGIDPKHHIIAANEGNAVGLASGYYLATGRIPVVYMQNSGEGNVINPIVSLTSDKVYGIPVIFVIGWRGEPEEHDEPQHMCQGEITLKVLEDVNVKFFIVDKNTTINQILKVRADFEKELSQGKQVAFVIKKNSFVHNHNTKYVNENTISRENAIEHIVQVSENDLIVSSTGKISRELYEVRENKGCGHQADFLTVGSMGHASSVALGLAINASDKKVWCVDGDGAVLMHMGALAVIGAYKPSNFIHVILNNSAHESVGGMPTSGDTIDFLKVAEGCGYQYVSTVSVIDDLETQLLKIRKSNKLSLLEIKCSIFSRKDLGRPTMSPQENKKIFMSYILR